MVDEVEDILREIAVRVRAEHAAEQAMAPPTRSNSEDPTGHAGSALQETDELPVKSSLGRIESYLTTTARAWDRLPPVVSNRSGAVARFELWIKRIFKRSTHWYVWEQVNFNAAVDHALRDTLGALSGLQDQLLGLRREMQSRYEAIGEKADQIEAALQSARHEIDLQRKELGLALEQQRKHFEGVEERQQQWESKLSEIARQRAQLETLTSQVNARVTELTSELRERNENLLQEQRVSFKQLALEISEMGTVVERGRREIQTRLQKLEADGVAGQETVELPKTR